MKTAIRVLSLCGVLAVMPLMASDVEHRLSIGAGGGQYVTGSCDPYLMQFGEAGFSYEAHWNPKEVHGFLGVRGSFGGHHVVQATGDQTEYGDTRAAVVIGAYAGIWNRYMEASIGIVGLPVEGYRFFPAFVMGRIRLGPEDIFYVYASAFDGPVVDSVGTMRFGLATKAWDRVHFDVGANFGPPYGWSVVPALSFRITDHVRVGLRAAFSVGHRDRCSYDWDEGEDPEGMCLGDPFVGGGAAWMEMRF